jgi:hypothetical protein
MIELFNTLIANPAMFGPCWLLYLACTALVLSLVHDLIEGVFLLGLLGLFLILDEARVGDTRLVKAEIADEHHD